MDQAVTLSPDVVMVDVLEHFLRRPLI